MKSGACMVIVLLFAAAAFAQEAPPTAKPAAPPVPNSSPAASPVGTNATFLKTADEILLQMSQILQLPIKEPLKKTLRSKDEIRAYLIREDKEDKTDAERYADDKTLEAFGLIPRGFPLDSFMLDVLTDQVAGLYDPKAGEFYIADWIPADEQKEVMAHELTHALEDQSFHIDLWVKAARPNDDAEFARDAVSEGSAMAAMVDYSLMDQKITVRDIPDVSLLIRAGAVAQMDKDPKLSTAPVYIRDELLFPYLAGTSFAQQFLKAHSGWKDIHLLFEHPPVSTQQILHPDLYLKNQPPASVRLPEWKGLIPEDWKLLEENVMGEFGMDEVLKTFLDENRANISQAWEGDRYATFENEKSKQVSLVFLLVLDSDEDAARFFGQYSDLLERKYKTRTNLFRRPNYFEFQSDDGGVYIRCLASRCLTVEGASRLTFDRIDHAVGWPAAPAPKETSPTSVTQKGSVKSAPVSGA